MFLVVFENAVHCDDEMGAEVKRQRTVKERLGREGHGELKLIGGHHCGLGLTYGLQLNLLRNDGYLFGELTLA